VKTFRVEPHSVLSPMRAGRCYCVIGKRYKEVVKYSFNFDFKAWVPSVERSMARSMTTASIATIGNTVVPMVLSQTRVGGVNGDLKRIKFGDGFTIGLEENQN